MQLDSVQIGVEDLAAGSHAYELLLGVKPALLPSGARRFQLQRGAVEVQTGAPGVHSIRFAPQPGAASSWPIAPAEYNGLRVLVEPAPDVPLLVPVTAAVEAIDHVVVFSADPNRAIALWRDRLGVRLAFDREFPSRGLRLLFFRSGGITLEFATPLPLPSDPAGDDRLHGVSYRVADLEALRNRLVAAGIDVSPVRAGHKQGTTVATVRSGTCGVPTLLLQARSEESPSL